MKKLFFSFFLFMLMVGGAVIVISHLNYPIPEDEKTKAVEDSCPIKQGTTQITYSSHTGSGKAIYTWVNIYPDHLVWEYDEARNNYVQTDTCKYDKIEFEKLVNELSKIKFSAKDNENSHRVGGAGYGYSFHSDSACYFHFKDSYTFTGRYDSVEIIIQDFIEKHKTTGIYGEVMSSPSRRY